MTDSGGGGTGKLFHKGLDELDLCDSVTSYPVGYCALHCLQLTLSNSILTVLGKPGRKSETEYQCTALQLLHGIYSLQKYHEPDEWRAMWVSSAALAGKPAVAPKRVPAPVLTRWWTVGVCALFFVKHWDILLQLCHGVMQRFNMKSASSQIASANWALMHTPEIRADVELVVAYHDTFFFKHFKWLQRGDPQIGNRPGFISRHVGVRYYLMLMELDSWYDLDACRT
jgi:hypothetical protein